MKDKDLRYTLEKVGILEEDGDYAIGSFDVWGDILEAVRWYNYHKPTLERRVTALEDKLEALTDALDYEEIYTKPETKPVNPYSFRKITKKRGK